MITQVRSETANDALAQALGLESRADLPRVTLAESIGMGEKISKSSARALFAVGNEAAWESADGREAARNMHTSARKMQQSEIDEEEHTPLPLRLHFRLQPVLTLLRLVKGADSGMCLCD